MADSISIRMNEFNQLASAMLVLVFAAALLVLGSCTSKTGGRAYLPFPSAKCCKRDRKPAGVNRRAESRRFPFCSKEAVGLWSRGFTRTPPVSRGNRAWCLAPWSRDNLKDTITAFEKRLAGLLDRTEQVPA
jgi:hypothetical protein